MSVNSESRSTSVPANTVGEHIETGQTSLERGEDSMRRIAPVIGSVPPNRRKEVARGDVVRKVETVSSRDVIHHSPPLLQVPNQRLFGPKAAARYLGVSDDTLRKYADLGQIPVYRFINGHRAFKLEDLNCLIDKLPLWNDPASDTTRAGRNGGIA